MVEALSCPHLESIARIRQCVLQYVLADETKDKSRLD
jgi:hypothetical protein